jgi:ribosomal protein S27E
MIRCKCNNCGYEIKTYDKFAGKRVRCPKCKQALQLPQGEGAVSPKPAAVIKFRCPNCDQKIGVPPSYGGKVVRCAKCKHQLRVPQAPGAAVPPKPQDEVAVLRAGHEEPSADGSTMPGLGDMSDLLQLEASAPSLEEPLRLSPAEDTSEGGAAAAYARQFPTRPSFQADEGEVKKKNKLVVPIVVAAVFIAALVIGYMSVKSFTSSLDTTESPADVDFDEAQQFTEDYITLLAGGDIEAAIEKLSPEVKAITDKAQIERLVKLVGRSEIVELTLGPTHFEAGLAGNQYYLWYRLNYEEGIQVFIACVREVDAGFTIDGIAAEGMLGQTEVIGRRSYDQLAGMALSSELRGIGTFLAKSFCAILVVLFIIGIIQLISMWIVFDKAGQPGWAAIVPFYNMWVLAEVGDKPGWMGLSLYFCNVIPVVGFLLYWVLWISICIGVAQTFERGIGFGIGLSLLPFIFYPILAFSRD